MPLVITDLHNDQPPRIDIELDPVDLKTSGPRLVCLIKSNWITETISFDKLNDGLSNTLLAMFPHSEKNQGLIVRIYGDNSDLIIDRKVEIHTMLRLFQYNMANQVLLTFKNGFLYTFVPGEQIVVNDKNMK